MSDTDLFYSARPAYPWSEGPAGLPALAVLGAVLIALTVWSYLGHPQASRRRVLAILGLRLLALLVALLTAVRPSVGVKEDPKLPSTLLIGVDLSESMTVRDEVNDQSRTDAVRRALEKSQPTLDELAAEQNVNVVLYGFGPSDFAEATGKYDPAAPAAAKKSDYGAYLNRTLEKWQGERQLRGHVLIGDGADNGTTFSAVGEAGRWRSANCPLHTAVAGRPDSPSDARDVAIAAVAADPSPVPVKNDLVIRVVVNALGFQNATVPVKVQLDTGDDYKDAATERVTLTQERNNEVRVPLKAPDKPGEVKVRVEIPLDSVPGDVAPQNNVVETYLTVTKEGVRVLFATRLGFEAAAIRRVLAADKRIDLYEVSVQPDSPPTPEQKTAFDFAERAYDVIIIGNASARDLLAIDPELPQKLRDQVMSKGVGVLFTGGHATFLGTANRPNATGWKGVGPIEEILPVDLTRPGNYPDAAFTGDRTRLQYLPTVRQADHFLNRLGPTAADSLAQWGRLNDVSNRSRFTGLSRMGVPRPTATVFAVGFASDARGPNQPLPANQAESDRLPPALVGHQIGDGNRGRVLALAVEDTLQWTRLGQPKTHDGADLHSRFWRQLVLWLAHQEEDEGAAFARPEFRRLAVRGKQSIKVGLRGPGGADALDPKFDAKVIAPGETEATARPRPALPDPTGGFRIPYEPATPGEYVVKVTATGRTAEGAEVKGEATARFLAYPEVSDEMLRTAADPDFMKAVASAGGGKAMRIEDLPGFFRELKAQPTDVITAKPRYLPDWRRNHSGGFLPGWLAVFATIIGTEWALRRLWGMA